MGVIFTYQNPFDNAPRTLTLRHSPYAVNWKYNLITQSFPTYGGEVIQVLSVNIDSLIIEGQLGREGAFGYKVAAGAVTDPRWGGPVPAGGKVTLTGSEQYSYSSGHRPGLHAMTEFFREYFAIASQGGDAQNSGRFQQIPVTLTYDVGNFLEQREWKVIPGSFPSFKRSNEDFAPEWRVECHVVQADSMIATQQKQDALDRLQDAVGFKVRNPFSDPAVAEGADVTKQIASAFREILPYMTQGDLEDMVWQDISLPNLAAGKSVDPSQFTTGDLLQGEVGFQAPKPVDAPKAPADPPAPTFVYTADGSGTGTPGTGNQGADQSPGTPPDQYKAAIIAQAPGRSMPGIAVTIPPGAVPSDGRMYFAAMAHNGAIETDGKGRHITVKYRDPPGAGNTIPVYI